MSRRSLASVLRPVRALPPVLPLGLLVLCLLGVLALAGPVLADGSETDNAAPSPWLKPPTKPKFTPCLFRRTLTSSWKKKGAGNTDYCSSAGLGGALCPFVKHCESYSNAAVLASEIWAYTWSDDSQFCHFDQCGTANSEGLSHEYIFYTASPSQGCSATIHGDLQQQFLWRIQGRGNVDVEVAGLMSCDGMDLKWPGGTISGGKAAFVGARSSAAPQDSGSIQMGSPPFVITIPFSSFSQPYLTPDEGRVFYAGPSGAGPIGLGIIGEAIGFRGYAKCRSYADEPGLFYDADVEGWIRDSNPGLTITLQCQGSPACLLSTTSTYKR